MSTVKLRKRQPVAEAVETIEHQAQAFVGFPRNEREAREELERIRAEQRHQAEPVLKALRG